MKKTISILVIICLVLGLTSSFAEDRTKNKKPRQRIELRKEEDRKEKIKGLKEEMRPYIDSATKDKKEIRRLVEKSKGSYKRAKGHIKKLLEERDSLTDEQIEKLKESLKTLKKWNNEMGGSKGDIKKVTKRLRNAKLERDYKKVREYYREINEIQRTRMENLKNIIEDLNDITEI